MYRTFAVTALLLGIVATAFGASSYRHLWILARQPGSVPLTDHLDYRIMTAGMPESVGPNGTEAAAFVRHLEFRLFVVIGAGLVLLLLGGLMLFQARHLPRAGAGVGAKGVAA